MDERDERVKGKSRMAKQCAEMIACFAERSCEILQYGIAVQTAVDERARKVATL